MNLLLCGGATVFNKLNLFNKNKKATSVIKYVEGKQENTIYFREMEGKFFIIKSEGPISELTKEEQQLKLEEEMLELGQFRFNEINKLKQLKSTIIESDELMINPKQKTFKLHNRR